jgi:tRNA A-37 threonylcarbamoyl transferase component Bud32
MLASTPNERTVLGELNVSEGVRPRGGGSILERTGVRVTWTLEAKPNQFGDYVLHDRIGAGGMAEIFLATARGIEGFEKRVVIKRILPSLSDDEQFVRMFIEEAKLCVALRHPNIVQVHDLGEIDAQYYIAMEYVDGRDLLKTLAACGKKKIGFPTDIALFIVMEVLKGLHYAHQLKKQNGEPLGIIHRDVSPSNVLLSFEGEVKIGDFGIAKANTREKTATGILKGKFGYMAPEQVTGATIDHRADVFAIGIVLYELLTGHRLFAGKNDLAVLEKVRDARIEPPARYYRQDLDDDLEHIVMSALSRDANDRYQSAKELHDAIHDYVFRSRATVGPAHLARFMQLLFLGDAEEVERRGRINLPAPRAFPMGPNGANGANGTGGAHLRDRLDVLESDGDFDEKTPLLDPAELPGGGAATGSSLSQVAFISDPDSWERAGSSALIEYVLDESAERSRSGPGPRARSVSMRPPPAPENTRPPAVPPDAQKTARTDIDDVGDMVEAIELETGNVVQLEAGRADTRPKPDDSSQSPLARVEALRRARQNDAPTDLDLSEESRQAIADVAVVSKRLETLSGRPPTPDRPGSGIDTAIDEKGSSIRKQIFDPALEGSAATRPESDAYAPVEIVERTHSSTSIDDVEEIDVETSEVEPTVRFDSKLLPIPPKSLLDDPAETTATASLKKGGVDPAEITGREREEYQDLGDHGEFGTYEVPDNDLPTSELDGQDLDETKPRQGFDGEAETEDEQTARGRGDSRTDVSLDAPDVVVAPVGDSESKRITDPIDIGGPTIADVERTDSQSKPRMSSKRDDSEQAEGARRAKRAKRDESEFGDRTQPDPSEVGDDADTPIAAADAVAEIRKARRASRMNLDVAKEDARSLSRRRPITARRPRPVLVPTDDDGEPALRQASPDREVSPNRRRRATATRSLSVVNPPGRGVSIRRPIVQEKLPERPRPESNLDDVDETGRGLLVDHEETSDGELGGEAKAAEPVVEVLPARRVSSGVTAALTEAALAEEEIAEIRRSTVGKKPAIAKEQLGIDEEEYEEEFGDDESTQEGSKVRAAIERRQSRKRIVTQSFVLYGEDGKPQQQTEERRDFDDESSVSAPMITSAGRLEDEGASDLFGALEKLDRGTLEIGFAPEEEPSLETESKDYGNVVETRDAKDQKAEYGDTKFGSLAPDTRPSDGAAPFEEDETTASVTDGQLVSVSALMRGADPIAKAPSQAWADEVSSVPRRNGSGISIQFEIEGERSDPELVSDATYDPGELEFSETDEPTEEQDASMAKAAARAGRRPRSILEEHAALPTFEETSNQRPAYPGDRASDRGRDRGADLVSDSFDIGAGEPAASEKMRAPIRPVSIAEQSDPSGVEAPPAPVSPAPKPTSALRRVVQRHKPVKEANRATGTPPTKPPPKEGKTPPIAMPAKASRAVPSAGQIYPPVQHVEARGGGLNKAATVIVLVAVLLAVAAAVSLLLTGPSRVPIPPLGRDAPAKAPAPPPAAPPSEAAEAPPPPPPQDMGAFEDPPIVDTAPAVPPPPPPAKAQPPPPRSVKKRDKKAVKRAPPASSMPTARLSCPEPLDFKLDGKLYKKKKKWQGPIAPGQHTLVLIKDGKRERKAVIVLEGSDVELPCPSQ